jgi:hypothetical protein
MKIQYELFFHLERDYDGNLMQYPYYFKAETNEKAISFAKAMITQKRLGNLSQFFALYELPNDKLIYRQLGEN